MRVVLAQKNFTAGDLAGNFDLIAAAHDDAKSNSADLLIFSELAICGYPVDDLLLKDYFLQDVSLYIQKAADLTKGSKCAIVIGAPIKEGDNVYNAALLLKGGVIAEKFLKNSLPNYKLFDEKRYFVQDNEFGYFQLSGIKFSVLICEDVWDMSNLSKVKKHNSDALIVINSSPFSPDKDLQRIDACSRFATGCNADLFYVNQVGAVDSFVFDGSSFVMNKRGQVVVSLKSFAEDLQVIDFDGIKNMKKMKQDRDLLSSLYSASLLSLRDYVAKTNFKKVVIGMSGGIDSALVAAIAVDALGSENVRLVALPTKYNSDASYLDAKKCSENLAIDLQNLSIQNIFDSVLLGLKPQFKDAQKDTTEQNIQSRIRGLLLMAISNKFNELLISTGNKSEMATGYATIYGDMNGAFNTVKDLYKTQIFALANWRNKNIPNISKYSKKDIIPQSIISKEPSAELDFDQKDSDSLPDYEILDQILYKLIEEEKSLAQIVLETGFEQLMVEKIVKLFYQNEYKRKQAPPGPKLSKMSFDRDRRYLITNKFWR